MLLPEADPRLLVHAYVDGELDPANAGAIEWLIANDAALAAERDRVEALQRALRNNFALIETPAALRPRIVLSERAGCPPAQLGWRSPLRSR
jgi:anti-sigma factor RsiW